MTSENYKGDCPILLGAINLVIYFIIAAGLALACLYVWGIGNAFAALIGKKFGKHVYYNS